jgi:hypothetical protein
MVALVAPADGGLSWPLLAAVGAAVVAAVSFAVWWSHRTSRLRRHRTLARRVFVSQRPAAAPAVGGRAVRPPRRERVTVIAHPFDSFDAVTRFQAAIRRLTGITDAELKRFEAKTLHLTVEYEDEIPLAERIDTSAGIACHVVSRAPDEIEVQLT